MFTQEFELVPHTADLAIRAYGSTIPELFRNALKGMFTSIHPTGPHISYQSKNDTEHIHISHFSAEHSVVVRAENREALLVDFLSECLYLSDIHNEAYFDATFTILTDTELQATVYGTSITGFTNGEIKAVTYHDLSFEQIDGTWQATVVFDI